MGYHPYVEHEAEAEDEDDNDEDVQHPVHRLQVRDDMVEILCEDAVQLVWPYPKVFTFESVRVRVPLPVIRNGFKLSVDVL